MDEKITTIKDRVLQIAEKKGINKEYFFEDLGLSYANFKGKSKKSALNSDSIVEIITKYNDICLEWLLTGEGSMLKTEQQIGDISNSTVIGSNVSGDGNQITHNDFAGMIELQKGYQQLLNRKDEQINRLLAIIEKTQGINEK